MTLRERSAMLRKEAVNFLDGGVGGGKLSAAAARDRVLFLQGKENLTAEELLRIASSQYDLTAEDYCNCMRKDGYWGGGPEIVALCCSASFATMSRVSSLSLTGGIESSNDLLPRKFPK